MNSSSCLITLGCVVLLASSLSNAQLTPTFYDTTCPNLTNIIRDTIVTALTSDPRIGGSILRLHFHDCFVNGCDASILLDNTTSLRTEKEAPPNFESARGYDVIDTMKTAVETACPGTVSCADMLTVAAQEAVNIAGGPSWRVPLGRRDSLRLFFDLATANLPAPNFSLERLKATFANVGLDVLLISLLSLVVTHLVRTNVKFIMDRLYNFSNTGLPDLTLNTTYLQTLRGQCPQNGNQSALVDLDLRTPTVFDNKYYENLKELKGLLQTDQELFSSPNATDTSPLVRSYADGTQKFFDAFVEAMDRMGNITPITGTQGEIRLNCRVANSNSLLYDVAQIVDLVSSI